MPDAREPPSLKPAIPLDYPTVSPSSAKRARRELVIGIVMCGLVGIGSGAAAMWIMIRIGVGTKIGVVGGLGGAALMTAICLIGLFVQRRLDPPRRR